MLANRAQERVALVKAAGDLGDDAMSGFSLTGGTDVTSSRPLHEQLERALDDPLTRGVFLDIGGVGNMAQIEELRPRLERLRRAGKPVVAYLEYGAGRADLYLASACDRVVMAPEAMPQGLGLRAERRYYRGLLGRARHPRRAHLVRPLQVGLPQLQRGLDPARRPRGHRAQPRREPGAVRARAVRRPEAGARARAGLPRRPPVARRGPRRRRRDRLGRLPRGRAGPAGRAVRHGGEAAHGLAAEAPRGAARVAGALAGGGGLRAGRHRDRAQRRRPAARALARLGHADRAARARVPAARGEGGGAARREPRRLGAGLRPHPPRHAAAQARDEEAARRLDGQPGRQRRLLHRLRRRPHLRRPLHPHRLDRRGHDQALARGVLREARRAAGRLRPRRLRCAPGP